MRRSTVQCTSSHSRQQQLLLLQGWAGSSFLSRRRNYSSKTPPIFARRRNSSSYPSSDLCSFLMTTTLQYACRRYQSSSAWSGGGGGGRGARRPSFTSSSRFTKGQGGGPGSYGTRRGSPSSPLSSSQGGGVGPSPSSMGAFHGGGPEKYGIVNPSSCTGQQFLTFLHRLRAEYKQHPTDQHRLYLLHILRHFSLKNVTHLDGRVVYQVLELLARLHPPSPSLPHIHPSCTGGGLPSSLEAGEISTASDMLLVQEAINWVSLYGSSPSTSSPKLVTQCLRQLLLLDCRDLLLPVLFGCKEVLMLILDGSASSSGSGSGSSSAAAAGGGGGGGTRGVGVGGDACVVWLTAMIHALTYHDGRTTSTPLQLGPYLEQLLHQVVASNAIEHLSSRDVRLLLEVFGMGVMKAPWLFSCSSPSSSSAAAAANRDGEMGETHSREAWEDATSSSSSSSMMSSDTPLWKTCVEHIFMILAHERGEEFIGSLSLVEALHLMRSCIALYPHFRTKSPTLVERHEETDGSPCSSSQKEEAGGDDDGARNGNNSNSNATTMAFDKDAKQRKKEDEEDAAERMMGIKKKRSSAVEESIMTFFALVTRRTVELLKEVEEGGEGQVEGGGDAQAGVRGGGSGSSSGNISSASVVLLGDISLLLSSPEHAALLEPEGSTCSSFSHQCKLSSSSAPAEKKRKELGNHSPSSSSGMETTLAKALHEVAQKSEKLIKRYFISGEASPDVAVTLLRMLLKRRSQEEGVQEENEIKRGKTTAFTHTQEQSSSLRQGGSSSGSNSTSGQLCDKRRKGAQAKLEEADWIARSSPTHPLSLLLGGPSLSPPPTGCGRFYEDIPKKENSSSSPFSNRLPQLYQREPAGLPSYLIHSIEHAWDELLPSLLLHYAQWFPSQTANQLGRCPPPPDHQEEGAGRGRESTPSCSPSPPPPPLPTTSDSSTTCSTSSSSPLSMPVVNLQRNPFPWSAQSVHTLLCLWGQWGGHPMNKTTEAPVSCPPTGSTTTSSSSSSVKMPYEKRVEYLRAYYAMILSTVFRHAPTRITPEDFKPFFMPGVEKCVYFPSILTMVSTCMSHWCVHQVLRWLRCTAEEVPCTAAVRQLMRGAATSLTPFMKNASSEQLIALWYYFGRVGVRQDEFAEAVASRFGKLCEEEMQALSSASRSLTVRGMEEGGGGGPVPAGGGAGRTRHTLDNTGVRGTSGDGGARTVAASLPPPTGPQLHLIGLSIVLSGFAGMEYRPRKPFLDAAPLLLHALEQAAQSGVRGEGGSINRTSASASASPPVISSSPSPSFYGQGSTSPMVGTSASSTVSWYALAEAATTLLAAYAKMLVWHFQVIWGLAEYLYSLMERLTLRQLLVIQLALQRMNIHHAPLTAAFSNRLFALAREGELEMKAREERQKVEEQGGMTEEEKEGRATQVNEYRKGFYGVSPTDLTALLSVWSRCPSLSSTTTVPSSPGGEDQDADLSSGERREASMSEVREKTNQEEDHNSPNRTTISSLSFYPSEEGPEETVMIFASLSKAIRARLEDFSAVELAEILISLARCEVAKKEVQNGKDRAGEEQQQQRVEGEEEAESNESISSFTTEKVSGMMPMKGGKTTPSTSATGTSLTATATAMTASDEPSLFDLITTKIIHQLPTIPPVALDQVLHAYALLARPHHELFTLASQRVIRGKMEIASITIASILSSFAATGTEDTAFFMEMIPRVRFVAQFGNPRDVTNVVFAYATVKVWHFKLFSRLADRAIQLRGEFSPVHLVRLMQAYGMVEMRYDNLFIEMSPRIQAVAHLMSANELGLLLESYARVHMHCPPVFEACAEEATKKAQEFTLVEAERLLWALATVGHVHPKVWLALCTQFPHDLRGKFLGVQQKMTVHPSSNHHRNTHSNNAQPQELRQSPRSVDISGNDMSRGSGSTPSPRQTSTASAADRAKYRVEEEAVDVEEQLQQHRMEERGGGEDSAFEDVSVWEMGSREYMENSEDGCLHEKGSH